MPPSTAASRSLGLCLGVAAVSGLAVGLGVTNPSPAAFEAFAAERLTAEVGDRLCTHDALPVVLHGLLGDCVSLVKSQGPLLGRLARDNSRRLNLGLLSLYRTEVGGQDLLGRWRLPQYHATTLAAAGQFLLLESGEVEGGAP